MAVFNVDIAFRVQHGKGIESSARRQAPILDTPIPCKDGVAVEGVGRKELAEVAVYDVREVVTGITDTIAAFTSGVG